MKTDEPSNSIDVGKNFNVRRSLGVMLLVIPPILVGLLYIMLQMINSSQAAPADAPEQGTMLMLFFVLMAGIFVGIITMAVGLTLIIRSAKR